MDSNFSNMQFDYLVSALDTNINGTARITSLLDFCQNTAWRHYYYAESKIGKILDDNQGWLLSKLAIEIDEYPKWGDTVSVETWSPGVERINAYRNFLIKDLNNKVIAKMFTIWIVIDIERGRPVRLNAFKENWPFGSDEIVIKGGAVKLDAFDDVNIGKSFTAKYSDIDVNRHVNNVKYIEWIIDSYNYDFLNNNQVKRLDINFISETVCGDEVSVGAKKLSELEYYNNIVRITDGKDICRTKILWKNF